MASVSRPPNGFLQSLSEADFESLRPHLTAVELKHEAILYGAGDAVSSAYFPYSGVVSLVVPLTQEFLAQMLGVRRTSVTMEAKKLHKAGLIQYRRGRILILDREGLEECACECYRTIRERQNKLITAPTS